jgi:membrane-bound lytic murein transglycosylase A
MQNKLAVTIKVFSLALLFSSSLIKAEEVITGYQFEGNGFQEKLTCFEGTYQKQNMPKVHIQYEKELLQALDNQYKWLVKDKKNEVHKANFLTKDLLLKTMVKIKSLVSKNKKLPSNLNYHLLSGEDKCGNTLFTGYYTPILKLKKKADSVYKYPLYRKPKISKSGIYPSRAEIDIDKKLEGLGLELGYSKSLLDNYFVHVQGSTIADFIDTGERVTLQYAGKNNHKYESLGKYLVSHNYISKEKIGLESIRKFFDNSPRLLKPFLAINQSYVFFSPIKAKSPVTASTTPAISGVTTAVDPRFIPFGTVLLIEYPILKNGKVVSREYRVMVANDRGGAIKGSGHVDIYTGLDKEVAGQLHHYGRVWLISI